MLPPLAALRIEVVASPETNDHQVRLLDPDESLIERFDDTMIGLDPDEVLLAPSPLEAKPLEQRVTIGRCGCGITECGSAEVFIRREAKHIFWRATHAATEVRFIATDYDAELARATSDFSWEPPDRTASRLIRASLDRAQLARHGLTFAWASGRTGRAPFILALMLEPGPYQLLVPIAWNGEPPEDLARMCLELMHQPPESWPHVEWFPQEHGLTDPPALRGAGWRAGR